MYDKDGNYLSTASVTFYSTVRYRIGDCTNTIALPVQPPVEVEKIWKFTKTETTLIITCNDVEVLSYLFADSSNSNCVPKWGGDIVEGIKFSNVDAASDFYKAGKGFNGIPI